LAGGVIIGRKAVGDVHFVSADGSKELYPPAREVTVKLSKEFGGMGINDAVEDAKRFAVGALQQKMAYKTRYQNCQLIVKNVKVDFTIKYGFEGHAPSK
jgi:hypothetical protein